MILEKIVEIIEEELGVDAEEITPGSNLTDDLDADSLDIVELVLKLEDEFDVKINEEDYPKLATVQQVADFIQSKKNETIDA